MPIRKCYCSVPFCYNNKGSHPYLSFHDFPADPVRRAQWIRAIRREEGPEFKVQRKSTYVCSQHFQPEEVYKSKGGLTHLIKDAVPSRFVWNDWGKVYQRPTEDLCNRIPVDVLGTEHTAQGQAPNKAAGDHDYALCPPPCKLDSAAVTVKDLELQVQTLEHQLQELTFQKHQPLIYKFCVTDDDFQYYCRFSSKEVFGMFWECVRPSTSRLAYWTKAQRSAIETPSPQRKLPLIDELFLFLCRVAAGLPEKTLSTIFEVSLSTVSRVIVTWTNYLYQVLGSLPTWMTKEQVQDTMPEEFKSLCPNVRVIIGCTEIRCEGASSTVPSEEFSNNKKYTTFKGLIGVNPSGNVTFVSKLHTGSISDVEMTKRSKLLHLLDPGDGVVADEGFLTENMLSEVGVELLIPPPKTSRQLSPEDELKTQAIARLRAAVERAICRVKEYHIWDGAVPLSVSGFVNQLWAVCCLMSNYQGGQTNPGSWAKVHPPKQVASRSCRKSMTVFFNK